MPEFAKTLRTWGEAGVIKLEAKITPKILNKEVTCMFLYDRDSVASPTVNIVTV
eukprot:CAMPEP_0198153590 /NCGR_PEP_ID=MMETSP1443-20131203/64844_1 /TAXON_ID=186043 /ORGANISM="Entomoneis sp., Strain CCMP2396" /LENGTH=53 /DNA_ID=CAMNT_0043819987 /DNA_START=574 /DNA_END=735 /DNA_ORIENTATION=+